MSALLHEVSLMKGHSVTYLGRAVDKNHFRTFIYSADGLQKLVESWKEYEDHMASGIWFSEKEELIVNCCVEEKPKRSKKNNKIILKIDEIPSHSNGEYEFGPHSFEEKK